MSAHQRLAGAVKSALAGVLARPGVNRVSRGLLRPFAGILPIEWLRRIPLAGEARVPLPSGATLRLASGGRDLIASALDWRGIAGYEPETLELMWKIARRSRRFFDVGASTGVCAISAALENPDLIVHAFEASPRMADACAKNLALNRVLNVTLIQAAAGAREGTIDLYVPPGASLPFGASIRGDFRPGSERVSVPAMRLDSFIERERIAGVDLLKLDTEGAEPEVLAGARRLIERDKPWIICEVLRGLTEAALHAELDRFSYRYFAITKRGLEPRPSIEGDPTYEEPNWLFVPESRLEELPRLEAFGTS